MSDETVKAACCGLAEKLGAAKTAELDAELRRPNHRSYRKLVADFPGANRSGLERHKKGCLGLGESPGREQKTFVAPETTDLPPVRRRPVRQVSQVSQVSRGTDTGTSGVPDPTAPAGAELATRAPAPESDSPSERRKNRVLEIVAAMADGTWDTPRDNVAIRAKQWGLSKASVEDMVREASVGAEVDPETVKARRAVALGRWGWGVEQAREAIETGPKGNDTMSKLLVSYAQMQAGWDKAAGVTTETTVTINVSTHPAFVAGVSAIFEALARWPEAAAAARRALGNRLNVLRQAPIETSGTEIVTVEAEQRGAAA